MPGFSCHLTHCALISGLFIKANQASLRRGYNYKVIRQQSEARQCTHRPSTDGFRTQVLPTHVCMAHCITMTMAEPHASSCMFSNGCPRRCTSFLIIKAPCLEHLRFTSACNGQQMVHGLAIGCQVRSAKVFMHEDWHAPLPQLQVCMSY